MKLTITQNRIISLLFRSGSLSRKELAAELSLSKAALTFATRPMMEEGILLPAGEKEEKKVGRREEMLRLNSDYGSFLGIDIRRHNFYFSLTDFAGKAIAFDVAKSEKEATRTLENIQKEHHVLAISVLMRQKANPEVLALRYPLFHGALAQTNRPWIVENNVQALARIYAFYHEENRNFLLIKYGPGLGSAIYVNGDLLGSYSELGHAYVGDKPLEEQISFSALLGEDAEEIDGAKAILQNDSHLSFLIEKLSFGLYNAIQLLHLEKIVLSGVLLSERKAKEMLWKRLGRFESDAALPELVHYPSYSETNEIKGSIRAFLLFNS
ncbi:MAG: ROK family transcriptional regulator [Bacilli bacterium]|nr:ROK family transcriptional regulator [Bacilli bacterium]